MSAMHNRRRRRHDDGGGHSGGAGMERWLLTYADMITLLMALFIVMWSISSVNTSKFDLLKRSLQEAFAGRIFQGTPDVLQGEGRSTLNNDGTITPNVVTSNNPQLAPPVVTPAQRFQQLAARLGAGPGQAELENLAKVKHQVDAYAKAHGLEGKIETAIDERGLVIRLLTDQLLFDTGKADLKPRALPLLDRIGALLAKTRFQNPIRVEGNTDDVPIATAQFRSNWELSTARATAVLEVMLAENVSPGRLSAAGFADQRPVASNATAEGRALNRRVEVVVIRRAVVVSSTG